MPLPLFLQLLCPRAGNLFSSKESEGMHFQWRGQKMQITSCTYLLHTKQSLIQWKESTGLPQKSRVLGGGRTDTSSLLNLQIWRFRKPIENSFDLRALQLLFWKPRFDMILLHVEYQKSILSKLYSKSDQRELLETQSWCWGVAGGQECTTTC